MPDSRPQVALSADLKKSENTLEMDLQTCQTQLDLLVALENSDDGEESEKLKQQIMLDKERKIQARLSRELSSALAQMEDLKEMVMLQRQTNLEIQSPAPRVASPGMDLRTVSIYRPCAGNFGIISDHFSCIWGIWGIERQSKPSTLSRTLSRALNITVPTVIAGQVKPIRTTVEQQLYTTPHAPYGMHCAAHKCLAGR